jgi:hypothetical protein
MARETLGMDDQRSSRTAIGCGLAIAGGSDHVRIVVDAPAPGHAVARIAASSSGSERRRSRCQYGQS